MRFCTDDERFGVILSARIDVIGDFFKFQLVLAGVVIGDAEDSIAWSGVNRLQCIPTVADARLAPLDNYAASALNVAYADDELHDLLVGTWAESLDQWRLIAYIFDRAAVFVAQARDGRGDPRGPVLSAQVPVAEYRDLVGHVHEYWREHSAA
jgi:hypothetical protein